MTDLRAEMSRIAYGRPEARDGEPALPWLRAAAVLAHFDPATLRGGPHDAPPAPASPAMAALIEASLPVAASRGRRLRSGVRRRMLAALATPGAMRAELARNPVPDTPVQQGLAALLAGRAAWSTVLDGADPALLAGLAEALDWVSGLIPDLPDPADIATRLARARLVAPLRKLVGSHFAGREDVLDRLARHLHDDPDRETLMLQGPGGVGKSTVLAKFVLDALDGDTDPPTVILLNLDNPELVIDDPFTLLQEAARQLRAQHPNIATSIDFFRGELSSLQRRSRGFGMLEQVKGGSTDWEGIQRIAGAVLGQVPGDTPILMVVDTFEEAQFTGPSAVSRLMRLIDTLRDANQRLRVVIAGRLDAGIGPERRVTLGALDAGVARVVLERAAGLGPLPDRVVQDVFRITGGNPLTTHLAARVLAEEGTDAFSTDSLRPDVLGRIHATEVQARLYGRILWHIHDTDVRAMAYPGLAVRLITPQVIRQVLAGPCGLAVPDDTEALRLFDALAREVALVEPDGASGALRHRPDVRRRMLADLRNERSATVARIDAAAVAYWHNEPGPAARAEEIYHLLMMGETAARIDPIWEPGVEPHLSPALEELPPPGQAYLASRLRVDLAPGAAMLADLAAWEASAATTARLMLREGMPQDALAVLAARADRSPGSPLWLISAEARAMAGDTSGALAEAARGIASAEAAGRRAEVVLLRLLESLVREGKGRFRAAGIAAAAAHDVARGIENPVLLLRALATLLRLHRRGAAPPGPGPGDLTATAVTGVAALGLPGLFDTPGLLRELAAEIGPRVEGLVDTALSVGGDRIALPQGSVVALRSRAADPLLRAIPGLPDWRRRAQDLIGPTTEAGLILRIASTPAERLAAGRLVSDLLAAEVDGTTGRPASVRSLRRRHPWREVTPDMLAGLQPNRP